MEGVHSHYAPNTAGNMRKILVQLNKRYIVLCLDPKLVVGYCGWQLMQGKGSIALNDRRKDTGEFQPSRCSELKGQWLENGERLGDLPEGRC